MPGRATQEHGTVSPKESECDIIRGEQAGGSGREQHEGHEGNYNPLSFSKFRNAAFRGSHSTIPGSLYRSVEGYVFAP